MKTYSINSFQDLDIFINGKPVHGETQLQQNDRVFFGGNHLYVFNNPTKKGIRTDITYENAQAEIAQNHAAALGNRGLGGGSKSKIFARQF